MAERGGWFDETIYLAATSTGVGKHKTEVIRQCLLADGVSRRAKSWMAASVMYLKCQSEFYLKCERGVYSSVAALLATQCIALLIVIYALLLVIYALLLVIYALLLGIYPISTRFLPFIAPPLISTRLLTALQRHFPQSCFLWQLPLLGVSQPPHIPVLCHPHAILIAVVHLISRGCLSYTSG